MYIPRQALPNGHCLIFEDVVMKRTISTDVDIETTIVQEGQADVFLTIMTFPSMDPMVVEPPLPIGLRTKLGTDKDSEAIFNEYAGLDPLDFLCVALTCRQASEYFLRRARQKMREWIPMLHRTSFFPDPTINHLHFYEVVRLVYSCRCEAPDIVDRKAWYSLWPVFQETLAAARTPYAHGTLPYVRAENQIAYNLLYAICPPSVRAKMRHVPDFFGSLKHTKTITDVKVVLVGKIDPLLHSLEPLYATSGESHRTEANNIIDSSADLPCYAGLNVQPLGRAVGFGLLYVLESIPPKLRPRLDQVLAIFRTASGTSRYRNPFRSYSSIRSARFASTMEAIVYILADFYSGKFQFTRRWTPPANLTSFPCDSTPKSRIHLLLRKYHTMKFLPYTFSNDRCIRSLSTLLDSVMDVELDANPIFQRHRQRHNKGFIAWVFYKVPTHPFWFHHKTITKELVLVLFTSIYRLDPAMTNLPTDITSELAFPNAAWKSNSAVYMKSISDNQTRLAAWHLLDQLPYKVIASLVQFVKPRAGNFYIDSDQVMVMYGYLVISGGERLLALTLKMRDWMLSTWSPEKIASLFRQFFMCHHRDYDDTYRNLPRILAEVFSPDPLWIQRALLHIYSKCDLKIYIGDTERYFPGLLELSLSETDESARTRQRYRHMVLDEIKQHRHDFVNARNKVKGDCIAALLIKCMGIEPLTEPVPFFGYRKRELTGLECTHFLANFRLHL